jgi:acyl-CoA thioesterase
MTQEIKTAIKARFSKSAFFNLLGCEIKELEEGKSVISLIPKPELLQSAGLLHGGVSASLCDISVAAALSTLIGAEGQMVTIEMKINYLKAVVDTEVFACCEIIKKGRKTAVGDVIVIDAEGNKYAACLATYAIL